MTDVMPHLLPIYSMVRATNSDKDIVTDILTQSFIENKSVLSVIKEGSNPQKRIKVLMEYAFDLCMLSGEVYISYNKKVCALILLPEVKPPFLNKAFLDLKLVFLCTGIKRAFQALQREKAIHQFHPSAPFVHVWFLGVLPTEQQKGEGSLLITQLIEHYCMLKLPLYLETSTLRNLPFYKKHGFTIAGELSFDYTLFILKREFTFCHALTRN